METISGLSNWKLTVRRENGRVMILRAVTCDERAALPDELWGLPVTALGDHALAINALPVQGEEVRLTCGPQGERWDNRFLTDLTLPSHLKEVGDYALYGCKELRTLRLWDEIAHWGGGSLMNCRSLRTFFLTRTGERDGESLAYLCDELHDELDVTVFQRDKTKVRLIFPDYVEDYEENCPAHHFDYKIYGSGHPYHHVFREKQLSLRDYDGLWERYIKEDYEPDTALRLAWFRLRHPGELSPEARKQYLCYLADHAKEALSWLLSQGDSRGFVLLMDELKPDGALLHQLCEQARRERRTEALALLLRRQRDSGPAGLEKGFDL